MSSWGTFFCTFSAGYTFAFLLFNSVLCVLQCLKSLIQSNQFPHLLPFHLLFLSTKTFDFIFINQQSLVVFLLEFWNLGPIDSPLTKQPHLLFKITSSSSSFAYSSWIPAQVMHFSYVCNTLF